MSEEKKNKGKKKIESINIPADDLIDPEMDEMLKRELMQEADALEEQLNNDPALAGVGVSDDFFASIVGKLKEQGIWEEDPEESPEENDSEEMGSEAEDVSSQVPEEDLEKIYQMLPEEDRRALELGRQVQKQDEQKAHKLKKRKRVYRFAGAAAAMLVLVGGVGMSTEANRKVALQAWNAVMENLGFRTVTDYVDESFEARSKSPEEIEAYEKISEVLNVAGVEFTYMPEGMEFLDYVYEQGSFEANLYYSYNEYIMNVKIINTAKESASYYSTDGDTETIKNSVNSQGINMEIWETNLNESSEIPNAYIGQIEYNGCRCIINGMIPLEEMEKIMKWMYFL